VQRDENSASRGHRPVYTRTKLDKLKKTHRYYFMHTLYKWIWSALEADRASLPGGWSGGPGDSSSCQRAARRGRFQTCRGRLQTCSGHLKSSRGRLKTCRGRTTHCRPLEQHNISAQYRAPLRITIPITIQNDWKVHM
jgi:hypothetical protein